MANSFGAHLESLRQFGRELESQLDALNAAKDTVLALAASRVLMGAFAEAELLVARAEASVAQVQALLEGIRVAIAFAEEVTHTVADAYRAGDEREAGSIAALAHRGGMT